MNDRNLKVSLTALALPAAALGTSENVQARCDSLDGPVVEAARAALTEKDVNVVLIRVQEDDDEAVHRAGQGARYTGLKPATDFGPSIQATDKALAAEDVKPVMKLLSEETGRGVRRQFEKILGKKGFDPDNIRAGREFLKAYVEYTHYVDGVCYAASASVTISSIHQESD